MVAAQEYVGGVRVAPSHICVDVLVTTAVVALVRATTVASSEERIPLKKIFWLTKKS